MSSVRWVYTVNPPHKCWLPDIYPHFKTVGSVIQCDECKTQWIMDEFYGHRDSKYIWRRSFKPPLPLPRP